MNNVKTVTALSIIFIACGWLPCGVKGVKQTRSYIDDEVTVLPGLKDPAGFKQYSGYLRASPTRRYHYWFVESQRDPANDPLVLWLNGGPGCSSVHGLLTENGPFRVSQDGEFLTLHGNSWNKIANMLFLESPAGTGFSYATDNNYTTDDNQVAADHHRTLKEFFLLFPHFSNHNFYITGESYAGIYIPTLLVLLKDDPDIEVQGAAVGNGYLAPALFHNTRIAYFYYHGLIGDSEWAGLTHACCNGTTTDCQFIPPKSTQCQGKVSAVLATALTLPVNPNNIYSQCDGDGMVGPGRQRHLLASISFLIRQLVLEYDDPQAVLRMTKLSSQAASQSKCTDSTKERKYLNRTDVRTALHIPGHVTSWRECSNLISESDPPYNYVRLYDNMAPHLLDLLKDKNIRFLFYNGDLDLFCDHHGADIFVDSLNLKETQAHKPWYYRDTDGSRQIGGFTRQFEGLAYLTVKGGGHMSPTDQSGPVFEILRRFLMDETF